jgi:hypothetical protein
VRRREPPEIRWGAVLLGGAVAVASGIVLFYVFGTGLGPVAGLVSVAAGALIAGWRAPAAGWLHGGLVATLWIAAEAVTDPLFPAAPDVVADAALTVIGDILRLALGVAAGWLGARIPRA